MREETVLERLNEIALSMDKKETCYLKMQAFMKELKDLICRNEMKKAGKADVYAAAKRLVKLGMKTHVPVWHGAYTSQDGCQYVADGRCLVKFFKPMELEKLDDNVQPYDYERILKSSHQSNHIEVSLPDVNELRAAIKIRKAEFNDCLWWFQENESTFNGELLLGMMEMLPNCTCYVSQSNRSPIIFESENGEGVLLPIAGELDNKRYLNK